MGRFSVPVIVAVVMAVIVTMFVPVVLIVRDHGDVHAEEEGEDHGLHDAGQELDRHEEHPDGDIYVEATDFGNVLAEVVHGDEEEQRDAG